MTVFFFQNGNTAVTDDQAQCYELQKPWLLMFVDSLVSKGIDPTQPEYILPSGKKARVFKTDLGYNWEIL